MRAALVSALICLSACSEKAVTPDDQRLQRNDTPAVHSRNSLGLRALGVSVDASGARFLWVPGQGVVQLERSGPKVVLPTSWLGERMYFNFEDLVVLDSRRIALIAQNEGIVVDRTSGAQLSRFCYLPGSTLDVDPIATQLSRSLGYDPQEDRLYVQPQTFNGGGTTPSTAQVGLFDPKQDQPLEWQDLDQPSFNAGGMAVDTRERVYFGMGQRLYLYDARAGAFGAWWDLSSTVKSIDGLTLDRQNRTLIVADGSALELVELKLDGLQ